MNHGARFLPVLSVLQVVLLTGVSWAGERPALASSAADDHSNAALNRSSGESRRDASPTVPDAITLGVVQQAREPELAANRDKIIRFISEAKSRGCRLVIFPEDALGSPVGTPAEAVDQAVSAIGEAARAQDVYVVFCLSFPISGFAPDKRGQRMVVIGPDGQHLLDYNKLICNLPPGDPKKAPGLFYVDGIPCSGMVCADRWLRGVEELPVTLGAKILIDCSANARREWIPEFSWYLPVTRAVRNGVYSIFCNMGEHPDGRDEARHGHSAIINPDGTFAARTDDRGDVLLVATLDLTKADAAEAKLRYNHPVFKPFWDLGREILSGDRVEMPESAPLTVRPVPITIAAVQMACSRDIATNVDTMVRLIGDAAGQGADVAVFPELAVTGAIDDDVLKADPAILSEALARIQDEAKRQDIAVIFGMPHPDGAHRRNSAFVIGRDGNLLTRYDQMVVDRRDLFVEGQDAAAMWFALQGVPAIVTVGSDARWNEIAELAAVRGAQLLFNIAYDRDTSEEASLIRTQMWVQFASFHTFGATVNAANPNGLARPSAPANGGSSLWEDFNGHKKLPGEAVEVFSQYSGCRIVSAGDQVEILYATRTLPKSNTYYQQYVAKRYPHLNPWYQLGAKIIAGDH